MPGAAGLLQPVRQIGYGVADLDAALARYQALGAIGGEITRYEFQLDAGCSYQYRGKPAFCRLGVALTQVQGMDHEFVQVLEGQHPSADFVERHGDGMNHLALYLPDISVHLARALELGGVVVSQGRFEDAANPTARFCYVEFPDRPNPLYELVEFRGGLEGRPGA
jgi:methylmalonyl-CoA/ethylmalonyl-CoA epimerase